MDSKNITKIIVAIISAVAGIIAAYIASKSNLVVNIFTGQSITETTTPTSMVDSDSLSNNSDDELDNTSQITTITSSTTETTTTTASTTETTTTSAISEITTLSNTQTSYNPPNDSTVNSSHEVPVPSWHDQVYATLEGSNIYIEVNYDAFKDFPKKYPLTWGVTLSPSETEEIGSKIICIDICMNKDFSVEGINLYVYDVIPDGHLHVCELSNYFEAYFDGQKMIFFGDITNPYIRLEDLQISSLHYTNN